MRIGIGIAVVAIGLIWSVAVMSEWVPVVSADAALGTSGRPELSSSASNAVASEMRLRQF
jgi:hypothetical protein